MASIGAAAGSEIHRPGFVAGSTRGLEKCAGSGALFADSRGRAVVPEYPRRDEARPQEKGSSGILELGRRRAQCHGGEQGRHSAARCALGVEGRRGGAVSGGRRSALHVAVRRAHRVRGRGRRSGGRDYAAAQGNRRSGESDRRKSKAARRRHLPQPGAGENCARIGIHARRTEDRIAEARVTLGGAQASGLNLAASYSMNWHSEEIQALVRLALAEDDGADFLSSGALTHFAPAANLSLLVENIAGT